MTTKRRKNSNWTHASLNSLMNVLISTLGPSTADRFSRRACDQKEAHFSRLVVRRHENRLEFTDSRRPTCPVCAVLVDVALAQSLDTFQPEKRAGWQVALDRLELASWP